VAYASTVHSATEVSDDAAEASAGEDAVRLPLPGGWMASASGAEPHRVVRAAAQRTPGPPARVPA
jgi:urease accessory protein